MNNIKLITLSVHYYKKNKKISFSYKSDRMMYVQVIKK